MITEKQATAARESAANLIDSFTWDDATIGAAIKVIDFMQAIALPWVKKLNPTLGAYVDVAVQALEDALRKMLPEPKMASSQDANPFL